MINKINKTTRRNFIAQSGLATAGFTIGLNLSINGKSFFENMKDGISDNEFPSIMVGYVWGGGVGGYGIAHGMLNLLYHHLPGYKLMTIGGDSGAHSHILNRFPECQVFADNILRGEAYQEAISKAKEDFGGELPLLTMETADYVLFTFADNFLKGLERFNPELLKGFKEARLYIYTSSMMLNYGEITLAGMDFWGGTLPYCLPLLLARKLGIPYGLYGQSFTAFEDPPAVYFFKTILEGASFVSCRDGDTVNYIKSLNINAPGLKFVPDSTFSFGYRDDEWGQKFMEENGLEDKKFIIVTPRTWHRPSKITKFVGEERSKAHVNRMQTIIKNWVRNTDMKVLIAVEARKQMPYHKTLVYDPLPDDIKSRCVVLDEFWIPERAAAIFHRARILVTMEQHSFLLAIPEGTPTVVAIFREAGRKIWMLRDFRLDEYMFDIDQTPTSTIEEAIYYINDNYEQESARLTNYVIPRLRKIEENEMKVIAEVLKNN